MVKLYLLTRILQKYGPNQLENPFTFLRLICPINISLVPIQVSVLLFFMLFNPTFSQTRSVDKINIESIKKNSIEPSVSHDLEDRLIGYSIYNINRTGIIQSLSNNRLTFEFDNQKQWEIEFEEHVMLSSDYEVIVSTSHGIESLEPTDLKTYKGFINGNLDNKVRFSSEDGVITGYFLVDGVPYFMEPLNEANSNSNRSANPYYVFYRLEDLKTKENNACGTNINGLAQELKGSSFYKMNTGISITSAACVTAKIAIAGDYAFVQQMNGVANTEKEIRLILNMVEMNYEPLGIRFNLVKTLLSDCSSCDPWSTTTDGSALLNDFKPWANNGGFGTTDYNVASLMTGRDMQIPGCCNIAGIAKDFGACTSDRYNVIEYYLEFRPSAIMNLSHEMGHNFGGPTHDGNTASTIMANSINSLNNTWSAASKSNVASYISQNVACFSACDQKPVPEFSFTTQNTCSGQVYFTTNGLTRQATSVSWDFGDGQTGSGSSVNHTYNVSGNYNVTLTATNENGPSTLTKVVKVGTNNSLSGEQTVGKSLSGGGLYNSPEGWNQSLIFDVKENLIINSVKLQTGTAGNKIIRILDPDGIEVYRKTQSISTTNSAVTVNLGVELGRGVGYKITTWGSDFNLYRSNSGVTYPYQIANLISITGSPAGQDYYYFFYDWKVQKASCDFTSVGIEDPNFDAFKISPNPTSGNFTIDLSGIRINETAIITLLDLTGRIIQTNTITGSNSIGSRLILDISNEPKGTYLLHMTTNSEMLTKKIIKQ